AALRAVEAEVGAIEHLVLLGQLAGASSSGDGGRGGGGGGAESMLGRIGAARRAVLCVWRELQQTGAEGGGRRRRHALLAVCAHCEAALARAHAHTAAQLAVGQSRAAVRLAASSNRWLLLVAVLLPLQYATGLFGMNIAVPWKHDNEINNSNTAWLGILAALLVAFTAVIAVARIKRLI
ncbi:hypothetical protein GGF38_001731, partial [Coemansia sp. RSA 25]